VGRDANGNPFKFGFARDVRILVTDQGTLGGAMSGVTTEEAEEFIGKSVADLYDMQSGVSDAADGIELPLYDLVGQILQQPVYNLLGGKGPTEVSIYSSNIHFEDLEPAQQAEGIGRLLRECKTDYDLGYRAFKVKIGRGFRWMQKDQGDQRDIDVTRAVREEFPDCKILVDANDGYTESDFENYITAVADCDLYCIEEPFHETIDDYKRLRDHMHKVDCKAKLMDGEKRIPSNERVGKYGGYPPEQIELLLKLAEEKLVDVLNMDLAIIGFTRWLRLMPELKNVGVLA
jgi:L-alanine-DL-glutamate epimerase-like enolase superfamily enzyme